MTTHIISTRGVTRSVHVAEKVCPSQRGATLVIALIILLVMSMIGIANMKSSTMQERMAANSHQKTLAKYAAESALREAEAWLADNVRNSGDLNQFSSGSDWLFSAVRVSASADANPRDAVLTDIADPVEWDDISEKAADIVGDKQVSRQPNYIIEYMGRTTASGQSEQLNWESAAEVRSNNEPHLFRITAIGWGRDENIYSVIESSYATGSEHFFAY